jgi:uncharacterized membrane protein
MQCPACHNEVAAQNTFCNHCGAALSGASATPPPPEYQQVPPTAYTPVQQPGYVPPPPGSVPVSSGSSGLSDSAAAAIAYITIIPAILFLILEPYNKIPLVRFHSFQCIALFVVAFVLHVGIMICSIALHFIPLSWLFFSLLHLVVSLAVFVAWLVAIIKASKGEWYKLPIIGDFAEKQARS